MSQTTNYNLVKPDEHADGWHNDVNGNFDTIDTTMKANEDAIALNTAHRNITSGNPHGVSKSDVGLGNVTNDEQATKTEYDAHKNGSADKHEISHIINLESELKMYVYEFENPGSNLEITESMIRTYLGWTDDNHYVDYRMIIQVFIGTSAFELKNNGSFEKRVGKKNS